MTSIQKWLATPVPHVLVSINQHSLAFKKLIPLEWRKQRQKVFSSHNFSPRYKNSQPPLFKVRINDVNTKMIGDTGATCSCINKSTFSGIQKVNPLRMEKTKTIIRSFGKESIKPLGKITVLLEGNKRFFTESIYYGCSYVAILWGVIYMLSHIIYMLSHVIFMLRHVIYAQSYNIYAQSCNIYAQTYNIYAQSYNIFLVLWYIYLQLSYQ